VLTVAIASVCSLLYSLYCPSKRSTCLRFLLVSLKKNLGKSKQKPPLIKHYCCLYYCCFIRVNWQHKCFLKGLSIQNPIHITRIWRCTARLKGRGKKKKHTKNKSSFTVQQ